MPKPSDAIAPTVHATGVWTGGGAWTCQIIFTSNIPGPDGPVDAPTVMVSLPWPLAKALVEVVSDAVNAYENSEGPIVLPKSYQARREATLASKK